MPRRRIYETEAEKAKAYRKRKSINDLERLKQWKATNKKTEYRKAKDKESRFMKRIGKPFIAIDGEGITRKKNNEHLYTLLSSSTGSYIEDYEKGLSTIDCLNYLLSLSGGIVVGFYITYDINMIIKDIPENVLRTLWKEGCVKWNGYYIAWKPSKFFHVKKGNTSTIIYDVSGFFQKSFIGVLEDYNLQVSKVIKQGKAQRNRFTAKDKEKIRKYNKEECDLLVQVMEMLRNRMIDANILVDKWYGAGAIASKIFSINKVKEYNASPKEMIPIFLSSYYGGRSQVLIQGLVGDVYSHDINSAYPYAMLSLPTSIGNWYSSTNPSKDLYGIYKVKWSLSDKDFISPFPFRYNKRIYWSNKGEGWYHKPEVDAAIKHYGKRIKVLDGYGFKPVSDIKPFSFLSDLYQERLKLIAENNQAQIVLKLGINAAYGKTAQSIGFKNTIPTYQNYFWAGYITSFTRAQVFVLAMQCPSDIVSFATDGVISKTQLAPIVKQKVLGQWEVKQVNNFFTLQSGVYCYDVNGSTVYKSRGFGQKSVDYEALKYIWQREGVYGEYEYQERRFIGLGTALQSRMHDWRKWIEQKRVIHFMPNGDYEDTKKGKWEAVRIYPPYIDSKESQAYSKKGAWFESEEGLEYLSNLEQPN